MTENITIRGFAATEPESRTLPDGTAVCSFRFASTPRWYDSENKEWRSGHTNWMTVTAFRHLSQNLLTTVRVGSPLIVQGRLKIKDWETENGVTRTSVGIDATSVGLDLSFGTANFSRTVGPNRGSAFRDQEGQRGQDHPSSLGGWDGNGAGEHRAPDSPAAEHRPIEHRSVEGGADSVADDPMTDDREGSDVQHVMS